jgi:hypothetical protein
MPTFITSPILGANLADTSSTPSHATGTRAYTSDGGMAVYVKALSEISTFAAVSIYADQTAQMLTTTTSASTKRVGFAQTSIASGYYGWVQTAGVVKVNLAANCDDNVPLYTTATAGVLDDAVVSTGLVLGVTSTVTISNATAVTCIAAQGTMIGTGDMD